MAPSQDSLAGRRQLQVDQCRLDRGAPQPAEASFPVQDYVQSVWLEESAAGAAADSAHLSVGTQWKYDVDACSSNATDLQADWIEPL